MGPAIVLKTVTRDTSTLKDTKRGGRQSVVTLWTQKSIHTDQRGNLPNFGWCMGLSCKLLVDWRCGIRSQCSQDPKGNTGIWRGSLGNTTNVNAFPEQGHLGSQESRKVQHSQTTVTNLKNKRLIVGKYTMVAVSDRKERDSNGLTRGAGFYRVFRV